MNNFHVGNARCSYKAFELACVAGAKRGGGGGARKARKRGKGRESHPFSPLIYPPPFFPIPYPFRHLYFQTIIVFMVASCGIRRPIITKTEANLLE